MAQPEITFRHGQCSASVYEKECVRGERTFTIRTVSFERRFIDREGHQQTTSSLRINDIPKAILVLNRCYEFLTANQGEEE